MTETAVIDRDQWPQYFDQLSQEHEGELIRLEVLDQTYGDQNEGERLPFELATYDPRDDVVVLTAGRTDEGEPALRHTIQHPVEVDVAVTDPAETVLRVVAPANTTLAFFYRRND
jgi:hypothetical protein